MVNRSINQLVFRGLDKINEGKEGHAEAQRDFSKAIIPMAFSRVTQLFARL